MALVHKTSLTDIFLKEDWGGDAWGGFGWGDIAGGGTATIHNVHGVEGYTGKLGDDLGFGWGDESLEYANTHTPGNNYDGSWADMLPRAFYGRDGGPFDMRPGVSNKQRMAGWVDVKNVTG